MDEYIEQHIDAEPEHLRILYRDANRRLLYTRMMSGHLQGRLLKMLTQMIRPRRVLELGTFAGYSTLCIAEGLDSDACIDTVEVDDELEPFLTKHFGSTELGSKIKLHIGDAIEVTERLGSEGVRWDMAYIDADKRSYSDYFRHVYPFIVPGGWIIADNTLWNGKVLDAAASGKTSGNSKEKQLEGIMEFNDMIAYDKRVEKVILPIRDGITLIRVKN